MKIRHGPHFPLCNEVGSNLQPYCAQKFPKPLSFFGCSYLLSVHMYEQQKGSRAARQKAQPCNEPERGRRTVSEATRANKANQQN